MLSGTLMANLLFIKNTDLPRFYRRRISRIFPVALAYIAVMIALYLLMSKSFSWKQALSAGTFTYNYAMFFVERSRDFDHYWSLCVEEHSYILLGLLAFLIRSKNLNALLILLTTTLLILVSTVVWGTLHQWEYYTTFWVSHTRSLSIVSAALLAVVTSRRLLFTSPIIVLVAFAAGIFLNGTYVPDYIKYTVGTWCLAYAVNNIELMPKLIGALFAWKPMQIAGIGSFSLYVWQQVFYKGTIRGGIVATIIVAIASYVLIEKPFRQYLNAHWGVRKASV